MELTPEEELVREIEQADEYKENVYRALTSIDKTLAVTSAPASSTAHVTTTPSMHARSPTPPRSGRAKLPKITLPRFSGDIMKWTTFWDSYESAVHSNDELSDVDKFNYLRSLLERTAYEAIAGLTLSSANYAEAVDILKKRFGNKQLIISKHMETLLNMDIVTSDQNLRSLRRLYDGAESHIRSLKALGVDPDSYGAMLSSVFLNKLPPELRLIISRQAPGSAIDVDTLMKMVENELTARERTAGPASLPRRSQDKDRSRPTSMSLFTGAQPSPPSLVCCYCQQSHPSIDCPTHSTHSSRRQVLRTSGRCFNCLRKGHLCRDCRSSNRCRKCKKKHHSSICEGLFPDKQPTPTVQPTGNQPTSSPTSRLNPDAPPYAGTPTSSTLCSDNRKMVLLQTARAHVHNPSDPQRTVEVRLLLDGGSQRSYITD